jgi:HAMP domain-containing protein
MTSPSKYTIQLLEGIHDDTQRHNLATDAARLLGTNAEQLEQLLARGVGARIARAGSEKRAEHVAGLLRSVGVNVEVVAPTEEIQPKEISNEFVSSTQDLESPAPAFEASFGGNSLKASPFKTPAFESASFESPTLESNPFESNPFESNPFEPASSQPEEASFAQDGFTQASAEVEAVQPVSEEAGSTWWLPNAAQASNDDPFVTPTGSDPFGSAGSSDPFASAGGADPFDSAGGADPFAAAGGADPFDSVIGAAPSTAEEEMPTSSGASDPFSTLLPGDDSSNWNNSNDQVSAPWLNSNALSSSAGTVPFEPVGASDPFAAAAGIDPFASAIVEQYTAKSTSSDPFGNDPFAAPGGSDPFASAGDTDPFGPATNGDPFGTAGGSDPFGPASDTYSPTTTTATVIRNDPFAAPMGAARDPFAPANDPFAAPSGDALAPVISLTSTSELPPQARAARDRAPRRSSIQTKTIVALIIPLLLVVAGVVGFLSYQLPVTITTLLKGRATAVAAVTAESLRPTFDRGDVTDDSIYLLSGLAEGALLNVPYGAFFMIEHESRDIRSISTDTDITAESVAAYFKSREKGLSSGEDKGLINGEVATIDGKSYIVAARQFSSVSRMALGKGYILVGLKMDPISEALRNTLIPIFVAIGITLLLALAIGTGLARSLLRPIIAATQQANRISLGDLDRTVPNTGNDEIGDLLVALEQMRISLKSMVARLRRDRA